MQRVRTPTQLLILSFAVILLFGAFTSGCATRVAVRKVNTQEWFERANRNVLTGELSERSMRILRLLKISGVYSKDREVAYQRALDWVADERLRSGAFVLAEISYWEAEQARDPREQLRFYLSAAQFAWAYLFDPGLRPAASSYDPAYRWCCDLYNRASGRFVEVARELELLAAHQIDAVVCTLVGNVHLSFGELQLHWDRGEHEVFLVAYNFEVTGLPQLTRTYGIGVPLVAVHDPRAMGERERDKQFLPEFRLAYPVTALLRFQGSMLDAIRGSGDQDVLIEAYDPLRIETVPIAGMEVPLEADLTTPLAYMFKEAELGGFSAMLHSDEWTDRSGLYMLHPYQEDRIPVVFVHGLMSSPLTWLPLFNDMLTDPVLREHYQFWFFMYPTGNPILYSASILRQTLETLEQTYDPQGTSPTFQNMVLVGHSMGGLVSKLQVYDSGNRIWDLVSGEPFEDTDLPGDSKDLIRKLAFFERQQAIQRLVLMATPHQGSTLATSWYGRLGAALITTSRRAHQAREDMRNLVLRKMQGVLPDSMKDAPFDGISNLAPDSQLLELLSTWEFPEDLPVHSIIGNKDGVEATGTDGVVEYTSAHVAGVESELVVHSGHNVQTRGDTILELRRILLEHLEVHGRELPTANK